MIERFAAGWCTGYLELRHPAQYILFSQPPRLHRFVPRGGFSFEGVATKRPGGSCRVKCNTMVASTDYNENASIARFLYDHKFVIRYFFNSAINR
jgi:hypothetical protein